MLEKILYSIGILGIVNKFSGGLIAKILISIILYFYGDVSLTVVGTIDMTLNISGDVMIFGIFVWAFKNAFKK